MVVLRFMREAFRSMRLIGSQKEHELIVLLNMKEGEQALFRLRHPHSGVYSRAPSVVCGRVMGMNERHQLKSMALACWRFL